SRGSRETSLRPAAVAAAAVPGERCMRRRRLRQRQAWSARGPLFFLVAAALGWVGASGAGCEYERITEQGDGSFQVPVDVRHTFDVPPADSACPEGYGGVVVELAVDQGCIHALFMEISDDYSHFDKLG
ncbi:unnamed protein product, partial [Ectocarpus sp. 8 AP-2014]